MPVQEFNVDNIEFLSPSLARITYTYSTSGNSTNTSVSIEADPTGPAPPITFGPIAINTDKNVTDKTETGDFPFNPPLDDQTEYTFTVTVDDGNGAPIPNNGGPIVVTVCFLAGTMIATPAGEVAVETLAVGDLVLTADGRAVPVMWLGRQTVATRFTLTEQRRPVLISAGALGEALPTRDLRVTADHAMLIDGVLVQAGALVNGSSIRRMAPSELGDTFAVYHIETESHEIVLAEGAATETFIDNVTRARFDNYAEFVALYGAEGRPVAELDQPRAMSARQVPAAILGMIAARAAVLAGETVLAA